MLGGYVFNVSFTTHHHQVGMAAPSCKNALGPLTFCTLRAEQAHATTSRKLFKQISPEADVDFFSPEADVGFVPPEEADVDSFFRLIVDSGSRAIYFSALYISACVSRRLLDTQKVTFSPRAAGTWCSQHRGLRFLGMPWTAASCALVVVSTPSDTM